MHERRRLSLQIAAECLATGAALALFTWGAYRLHVRAEPAALLYLMLIVVVSLRGHIVPALLAASVGAAAWDYFFTGPQVTPGQRELRDVVTLVAFLATAFVIARLVRAMRTSEGRWRNVFDNNPTMYFMVDAKGTVLSVNPAGAHQLGYTAAELVGNPVLNVFLEEDKAAANDHVARCLAQLGESMSWELRKVRKDGTMIWVRETARAVQLGIEPPIVLIACEDITSQKAAQQKIHDSESRYRNIFQLADVSIWEEDFSQVKAAIDSLKARGVSDFRQYFADHPDFVAQAVQMVRIVDVNDATLRLFGATSRDELLVSLHKVFTPETLDVFAGELLAVAAGRTSFAAETSLQTLAGDQLDVLFTIAFPAEVPRLERVLVSIMDVTARKRAEESLRTAQAELSRASTLTTMGQLAGSIAHELRQPLAAIAMNGSAALRWLNRDRPDLDEARQATSRTVREAHRADEVIRSLRALIGGSEPLRAPLDVNQAIQEVLELARGELRRNDVSVHADLVSALPPAVGDRVQLQQVFLNLVVNAIEAMAPIADRPKVLVIRTERAPTGEVGVAVEDTGPGLDPTTQERIFDPFFTTKPHGLGMGLSICRSIVEAHGGRLSTSPRSPHGVRFSFTVPTMAAAQASQAGLAAPVRRPEMHHT